LNVSEVNAGTLGALAERASAALFRMLISPYIKERLAAARFTTPTPVRLRPIRKRWKARRAGNGADREPARRWRPDSGDRKLLRIRTPGIAALVLVANARAWPCKWWSNTTLCVASNSLPAALVVGGLSEGAQLPGHSQGSKLVVATPGRLEDYLDRSSPL